MDRAKALNLMITPKENYVMDMSCSGNSKCFITSLMAGAEDAWTYLYPPVRGSDIAEHINFSPCFTTNIPVLTEL